MRKLIYVVAVSLILAACGSSKPKVADQPQATADLQAPTFPSGSTMEKIQKSGKIRIGVLFNQPGFGVKNAGDDNPVGFDIEIAKLVAQGIFGGAATDVDQHIEYVETVSTNRETFLNSNKVDIVIAAYPITAARKAQVAFAGPYYVSHGDLMVAANDHTLQQVSDVNGRNVCAKTGSSLIASLQTKAPQVNIVNADTYAQCIDKLKNGIVNAIASDQVVLAGLVLSNDGLGRVLNSNFSDDPYGIGLPQGDNSFEAFLDDRIQAIEKSGDWAQAYKSTLGQLGLQTPQPPAIDRSDTTTANL